MTNSLGAGNVNLATCVQEDEARVHGRTAFERGVTRGELFRQALLEFYERHYPHRAEIIAKIRQHKREIGSAGLTFLLSAQTLCGWIGIGDGQEFARAGRTRTRRNEAEIVFEEAA